MRIGFFDSGIGGLTVLHEALNNLPDEDYIYFADTANVPYGTKPKETVRAHIFEAVEFLAEQEIKALVVACNTATSVAVEDLRKRYSFPIIGMEPAVKPAVEKNSRHKRVLVLATQLTLREAKFKNLVSKVDNEMIVDFLPAPGLVQLAEGFVFDEAGVGPYLRELLGAYDLSQYGTVVLGCTHFVFFRKALQQILPSGIQIIDGNEGTVKHLRTILERGNRLHEGEGNVRFCHSGRWLEDPATIDRYETLLKGNVWYQPAFLK